MKIDMPDITPQVYISLFGIIIFGFLLYHFLLKKKYPSSALFVYILTIAISVLFVFFNMENIGNKSISLISGVITGLIILILSIMINYHQIRSIDRFKSLKIIDILKTRDDEEYYRKIIDRADKKLWILGVTANRFLDDFANIRSSRKDKRILISKIEKGMKVKLLLANIEEESDFGKENHRKYSSTIDKLNEFNPNIQASIECRFYSDKLSQSIFYTDTECLVGPIFPDIESQHTPCIHLYNSSPYINGYLDFFNNEWEKANKHIYDHD